LVELTWVREVQTVTHTDQANELLQSGWKLIDIVTVKTETKTIIVFILAR